MFPIFTTTEQYRQIHLGHHEYTNDWDRDPEILNVAETRRMADFPMTPWEVFKNFAPASALAAHTAALHLGHDLRQLRWATASTPTKRDDAPARQPGKTIRNFRPATALGLAYVAVMALVIGAVGLDRPGLAVGRIARRVLERGVRRGLAVARVVFLPIEAQAGLLRPDHQHVAAGFADAAANRALGCVLS